MSLLPILPLVLVAALALVRHWSRRPHKPDTLHGGSL